MTLFGARKPSAPKAYESDIFNQAPQSAASTLNEKSPSILRRLTLSMRPRQKTKGLAALASSAAPALDKNSLNSTAAQNLLLDEEFMMAYRSVQKTATIRAPKKTLRTTTTTTTTTLPTAQVHPPPILPKPITLKPAPTVTQTKTSLLRSKSVSETSKAEAKPPTQLRRSATQTWGKRPIRISDRSLELSPSPAFGRLWSCGQNIAQQLGLRHDHDVPKYQAVKLHRDKNDNVRQLVNAKAIAAGAMSSYAIDQQQRLWSFGSNDENALGRKSKNEEDNAPALVNGDGLLDGEQVSQIVAGSAFAAAVTTTGKLFIWGQFREDDSSVFVPLGALPERVSLPAPIALTPFADRHRQSKQSLRVTQIAAGNSHLLILDNLGRVFAMGWNAASQLGTGTSSQEHIDTATRPLPESKQMQLNFIIKPVEITSNIIPNQQLKSSRVSQIFAAGNCSWCHVATGKALKLFAWGSNTHGQLGTGTISIDTAHQQFTALPPKNSTKRRYAHIATPTRISTFANDSLVQICGGVDFTLMLTANGHVYACGRGDFGQLGTANTLQYMKAKANAKKAYICARPKRIEQYVWQHQSWHGDQWTPLQWLNAIKAHGKHMPAIQSIAACSRSAYAVTVHGDLLVWGDNYTGQLGLGFDSEDTSRPIVQGVLVPVRHQFKQTSTRILGVCAGYGHSLITVAPSPL